MRMLFKLSIFMLALFGISQVRIGDRTVLERTKEVMARNNITIDHEGWEKIKALLPSWNTSKHYMFSDRRV